MIGQTVLPSDAPWRLPRKAVVVALVSGLVVVGAGVGYANWSASGSGSGQAKSGSAVSVTVAAATGTADLYPGASGAVFFTLNNTNPYPVRFTSATFGTVTADDSTACPVTNVSTTNKSGLTLDVAANTTSATLSVPAAITMASNAPDGCQSRTFTVAVTLSGTQQ